MAASGYTSGDPAKVDVAGDTMTGTLTLDDASPAASRTWVTNNTGAGATPSSTVTAQTSYGLTSAAGAATTYSRGDHSHGTPPQPFTPATFSQPGTVSVAGGTARLYNDSGRALTILAVRASAGTAPTGQSLIVDVNVNGTTIFTTQANRPAIAAAANTSGKVTTMDVTTVADGSYLTVDVDQVGSGTAGADLTVQIELGG